MNAFLRTAMILAALFFRTGIESRGHHGLYPSGTSHLLPDGTHKAAANPHLLPGYQTGNSAQVLCS
jgi:hypothetical protein